MPFDGIMQTWELVALIGFGTLSALSTGIIMCAAVAGARADARSDESFREHQRRTPGNMPANFPTSRGYK